MKSEGNKMSVKIGDIVPDCNVMIKTAEGVDTVSLRDFSAGRTVALFVVPGAFTPTCSVKHAPSYLAHYDSLMAAGIDEIACLSVNDSFVMEAWGRHLAVDNKITMMADMKAEAASALGIAVDMGPMMGVRANRSAFVLKDGLITHIFIEEPSAYEVSSAEHMLAAITG